MNTRQRILIAVLLTLMVICGQAFFGKSNGTSRNNGAKQSAQTVAAESMVQ